jgi:hypothetical protein
MRAGAYQAAIDQGAEAFTAAKRWTSSAKPLGHAGASLLTEKFKREGRTDDRHDLFELERGSGARAAGGHGLWRQRDDPLKQSVMPRWTPRIRRARPGQ